MSIIIEPKLYRNIARVSHPLGCQQEVINQINYVKTQGRFDGPKKVLILGASSSYGLASRIALAFGCQADTIGVSFERGVISESKLATAGWWNNIFFKQQAEKQGLIAKNFIGDAFANETKQGVINYLKNEFGKIDLLIYSLATGKRTDPNTQESYSAVIKPIGKSISGYSINLEKEEILLEIIQPANQKEINDTIKVMGGEDWELWVKMLKEENLLNEGFKTTTYTYIGSQATKPFYGDGTLGQAKRHAESTSKKLNQVLQPLNGEAITCSSKAITSKASAVIPIFPIYASSLYKVMIDKQVHETPIMHKYRFFKDMLYGNKREYDKQGILRPDSWELRSDVQEETLKIMKEVKPDNFRDITAFNYYKQEFLALNGFGIEGVDYSKPIDIKELAKLEP